jgi:parvulin-like peptidyl-prolyl isomerase
VLLTLIVQIGFLILARSAAATSVEASLRRAVVADLDIETVTSRLERDVTSVVPGAQVIDVEVTHDTQAVRAVVSFRWVPPGPDLVPVTVSIERSVARVVPP